MGQRRWLRVLVLEPGAKRDAEGKSVGDDWLLCYGEGRDERRVYLTTDGVNGSDVQWWMDPLPLARITCAVANGKLAQRVAGAVELDGLGASVAARVEELIAEAVNEIAEGVGG